MLLAVNGVVDRDSLKEVLRISLNHYEDDLILYITKSNANAKYLDDNNIKHDIEVVEVPKDEESSRNKLFMEIDNNNIDSYIDKLSDSFDKIELSDKEKVLILKALKEYCIYLEQVNMSVLKNKEVYDDIFNKDKNVK